MIAREGMLPISVVGIAGAASAHFAGVLWSLPLWALAAYLLYLFRETIPDVPNLPLAVLSPGDGRVLNVSPHPDPYLERDAHRVRIVLAGLGIGVLRSPIEGKIMDYRTSAQPFNRPAGPAVSDGSPNCYSVQVRTDEGDDVVFAVSSLRPISRFKLYAAPGERVGIGQRIGFLYFGNIVDLFMPSSAVPGIEVGARTRAGSTVLGHLEAVAARPESTTRVG
jgi:phosphatidylserine decarboxylase